MCYFDGEPAELWKVTHPKARRPHRCGCSTAVVAPGQHYEREFMLAYGSATTGVLCACCALARQAFAADPHHELTPNVEWFREALRECFDGARPGDPEVREWRDLYAGILRRERSAKRAVARG